MVIDGRATCQNHHVIYESFRQCLTLGLDLALVTLPSGASFLGTVTIVLLRFQLCYFSLKLKFLTGVEFRPRSSPSDPTVVPF